MDLLVHLIKKNELDIYDIPIALVTEQYLLYIEWMQSMNIEFAAEFIVMASTLTQIKSRMLLPNHGIEEDEDDPRMEIARPLLEYLQMKSVAEQLVERNLLGENTFYSISILFRYQTQFQYNQDLNVHIYGNSYPTLLYF